MQKQNQEFVTALRPEARPEAIVICGRCRFTVLTSRLIRMEFQADGRFTDAATQRAICREFPAVPFRVKKTETGVEIRTEDLWLTCQEGDFTAQSLQVRLTHPISIARPIWSFGDTIRDLKGTARTLDEANGPIPLEPGLLSREGYTVLDDSESALFAPDGSFQPKKDPCRDLYFFGYGHDYLGCLRDFYTLSGAVPRLPRYLLGNWWSRYYPYTQEGYQALMDRFQKEDIPLAVSVIDMDWHLTDIPADCGTGWTGYTWNRDLFPDPEGFLQDLHRRGLRVTLNVHPAEGVGCHEEAYRSMAEELGRDPDSRDSISFDPTDPAFMDAYFRCLHHPLEKMGVDFWWLDWQQGTASTAAGLDPLWLLNHAHFLDRSRDGKLPITFSRYGGIGSHRYPIGFSGDCVTTWESLRFQPYFTANASNAGYSWWSNDIGGHMLGVRDDELTIRWVQLGVFSPILRLHSTRSEFYGKEPWNYGMEAGAIMTEFLRLRHRLIPYIHSMNYRTAEEKIPLMEPMYYRDDVPEAYTVPNQYRFGTSLVVCPITEPRDSHTLLAPFHGWLPEGIWYDLGTDTVYRGGRRITFYRTLDRLPLLMPAGGILPLTDQLDSHLRNPERLTILVVHGADGDFTLVEDDCSESPDSPVQRTHFRYQVRENRATFSMETACTGEAVAPGNRIFHLEIRNVPAVRQVSVSAGQLQGETRQEPRKFTVDFTGNKEGRCEIGLELANEELPPQDIRKPIFAMLQRAQIEYVQKDRIWRLVREEENPVRLLARLGELSLETPLYGALVELIAADR